MNISKKINLILIITVLVIVNLIVPIYADTQYEVTVDKIEAYAGDTDVEVNINIKNYVIAGTTFYVEYDPNVLKLKDYKQGVIALTVTPVGNCNGSTTATCAALANTSGDEGILLTLVFDVLDTAAIGTTQINFIPDDGSQFYYEDQVDIDFEYTITNGSVTVKGLDFTGITLPATTTTTYDGTAKSVSVSGAPDDATVTYEYKQGETVVENPKDAGTYTVTATVEKAGYNPLTLTGTLVINPKELTVEGLTASDKVYDGTTAAEISGGSLNGKAEGDDVTATFPSAGTFATATAGDNIAVDFASITLSGGSAKNYTLKQPTLTANITRRPITLTAENKTMYPSAAAPEFTSEITDGSLVDGHTFTATYTAAEDYTKVGTYDIVITGYTIKAGETDVTANYDVTTVPGVLKISEEPVPVDITTAETSYTVYTEQDNTVRISAIGDNPITWKNSGVLPTGMTFENGVISGTPIDDDIDKDFKNIVITANNTTTDKDGNETDHEDTITITITVAENPARTELKAAADVITPVTEITDVSSETDAANKIAAEITAQIAETYPTITVKVTVSDFNDAVDGDADVPEGTAGSLKYTYVLENKGLTTAASDTVDVTINPVAFTGETTEETLTNALEAVNSADYTMAQVKAGTSDAAAATVKTIAENAVGNSAVKVEVTTDSFTAAIAGSAATSKEGTDGEYTFTITVSKGTVIAPKTTEELTAKITATPFDGRLDIDVVNAAVEKINNYDYKDISDTTANTEADVKAYIEGITASVVNDSEVIILVETKSFEEAVQSDADSDNVYGTNGTYEFEIELSRGAADYTVDNLSISIIPTPYAGELNITAVNKAVEIAKENLDDIVLYYDNTAEDTAAAKEAAVELYFDELTSDVTVDAEADEDGTYKVTFTKGERSESITNIEITFAEPEVIVETPVLTTPGDEEVVAPTVTWTPVSNATTYKLTVNFSYTNKNNQVVYKEIVKEIPVITSGENAVPVNVDISEIIAEYIEEEGIEVNTEEKIEAEVKLLAANDEVSSADKVSETITVTVIPVSAPTNVILNLNGKAEWDGTVGADYEVTLYKDGEVVETITTVATSYNFFSVMKEKGDGEYYVSVTAKINGSKSAAAKSATVEFIAQPDETNDDYFNYIEQQLLAYRRYLIEKQRRELAEAEKLKNAVESAAEESEPAIADVEWDNPFTDVFETDKYYDAIRYVYEHNLFEGYPDNEFKPEKTMSRGMIVTVLGRIENVDVTAYTDSRFADVPLGEWYTPYVEWAADSGIVTGHSAEKFAPEDDLTIEQVITIFYRYAKYIERTVDCEYDLISSYTDSEDVSDWAETAIEWALENGIYAGEDDLLLPTEKASRALVASMFHNFDK